MHTISSTLTLSWDIHDNWTEILAGTYFILNGPLEETTKKIPALILTRTVIITSHQLVEVMFFNTVRKYIDEQKSQLSTDAIAEIEDGFKENIGIKKAMKNWPLLLVGRSFDRSREPFCSQERLRSLRNESIHWPSGNSVRDLAHSAYYTGVIASEHIYSHFFLWEESEYSKFVIKYPASTSTHLVRAIQKTKRSL